MCAFRNAAMFAAYMIVCGVWVAALAQTRPEFPSGGPFKPGGVMSRNMELLSVIPVQPKNHDQFETVTITYPVTGGTSTKTFVVVSTASKEIRLVDVTDPRNVDADGFVNITSKGYGLETPSEGNVPFEQYQIYQSGGTPSTTTYNGDVFLVAYVPIGNASNTEHQVVVATGPAQYGRFMIFNLTKACSLRATGTSRTINVHNSAARDVTYNGTAQNNPHVYLGYVKADLAWKADNNGISQTQGLHSLWVDPESGIMAATPHRETRRGTSTVVLSVEIDLFDLSTLTTVFTPLQTTLQELPRLSSGNGLPFKVDGFGTNRLAMPRDIFIERVGPAADKKVRLTLACISRDREFTAHGATYTRIGGVATTIVNYSNPAALTAAQQNEWAYDIDRERPLGRYSADQDWGMGPCHTAVPFYPRAGGVYMLTADEILGTHFNPFMRTEDGNSVYVTINGTTYKDARWPIVIYESGGTKYQDDKRLGTFMRVWSAEENATTKALSISAGGTTATTNGAFTQYDPLEIVGRPNDLYYGARRTNDASSSTIQSTAAYGPTSSNKIGVGTVHRPVTVRKTDAAYDENDDDVFVAHYAQGVRIVNLKNVGSTNRPVLEKAFFDFIPTLTYDPYDPYFYLLSHRGQSAYETFQPGTNTWPMYYRGVMHCVPDFGDARIGTNGTGTLPSDEKFVHAAAFGEGYFGVDINVPDKDGNPSGITIPKDPQEVIDAGGRNWLPEGGLMIFRYFDNELGGTLKGYTGSGTSGQAKWAKRPYQTINLQGDFDLKRDVTIDASACVQLIPAHENDPGTRDVMRLRSTTGKKIVVYGTLNISVPETSDDDPSERALRANITIDVPIEIKSGGVVNVYGVRTGRRVQFLKSVTCDAGGTWKFHPGAVAELVAQNHTCNGIFVSEGTATKRVSISGRVASGPTSAQACFVNGAPTYSQSPSGGSKLSGFQVHYTDCENVYFNMKNFQTGATTKEVLESSFTQTQESGLQGSAIVRMEKPHLHSSNPPGSLVLAFNVIDVENCRFTYANSTQPGALSAHIGVEVAQAPIVRIAGSQFDNLFSGVVVATSSLLLVDDCDFNENGWGVFSKALLGRVCSSNFTDNEFSFIGEAHSENFFHDNIFTGCVGGVFSWTGGRYYLRRNYFGTYLYGVNAKGSTLYLRNLLYGEQEYELGRNDFLSPAATFQFAGWPSARPVFDIVRGPWTQLYLDCGKNDFAANSTYHVYGQLADGAFNASDNRWANPGGVFNPRTNVWYTGANFNTQEDPDPSCALLEIENECGPPIDCPSLMNYVDLTTPTNALYAAINALNTDVGNTALTVACRRAKVWELAGAVTRTDSSAVKVQSKSALGALAANTGLASDLRSAAYMAKARIHENLGELDSAQSMYATVMSTFPSLPDSLSAHWSYKLMTVHRDTTGKQDSLMRVFTDRVMFDLRRTLFDGGMSKSSVHLQNDVTGGSDTLSFDAIVPNPANGECRFMLTSTRSAEARLEIVDVTGSVLRSRSVNINVGVTSITEDVASIRPGMYFVRIVYAGTAVSLPLVIQQ